MKKIKVLVLGSTGMLGWVVTDYLKKNEKFMVIPAMRSTPTSRESGVYFDVEHFPSDFAVFQDYDYIINCIGIIKPHCKDSDPQGVKNAINVNARFPWLLSLAANETGASVIQIATDCVFSGIKGQYTEKDSHDALDVYGKTKSLGEVFNSEKFLNIRCSIIGPEKKGKLSLLEWFLSQPSSSSLNGFSHHLWNGVTTLQFAELCEKIILKNLFKEIRTVSSHHHFVPNNTVNKFDLLTSMKKIFKKNVTINEVNSVGPKVDRTLSTNFNLLKEVYGEKTIEQAMAEIKPYCDL